MEKNISAHTNQRKIILSLMVIRALFYFGGSKVTLKEIFTFENLYEAHKSSRLSKQHKKETIDFEINLYVNIYKLIKKIVSKSYKLGAYHNFYIYEPKERLIEALSYQDRVVIKCFCNNVLIPKIDRLLINDNIACRKGKGTLYGIKRLEKFLKCEYIKQKSNDIYYLKCDIKKYFPNIDHEVLLRLLNEINFSEDEMWFIRKLIKEQPNDTGKGLTLGNQSSQWFALFYLNKVDRLVKEKLRIKGYVRYMDDMILIHSNKAYLQQCKKEIESYCKQNLKLELNEKTQIGKVSDGIDFLGFRHILTKTGKVVTKLRRTSKIRMKRHLKNLDKLYKKKLVDKEYVLMRKNAYYAHILYSNEKKLIKTLQQVD